MNLQVDPRCLGFRVRVQGLVGFGVRVLGFEVGGLGLQVYKV